MEANEALKHIAKAINGDNLDVSPISGGSSGSSVSIAGQPITIDLHSTLSIPATSINYFPGDIYTPADQMSSEPILRPLALGGSIFTLAVTNESEVPQDTITLYSDGPSKSGNYSININYYHRTSIPSNSSSNYAVYCELGNSAFCGVNLLQNQQFTLKIIVQITQGDTVNYVEKSVTLTADKVLQMFSLRGRVYMYLGAVGSSSVQTTIALFGVELSLVNN